MGGSSKQVVGYKYLTNLLLFIGNPIEKVLGINFDKRGWHTPLIDEMGNPLSVGVIEKATLYGENEGGVAGQIHARYGTDNQEVVSFYKDYMDSKELPTSAYPYQSYLAFPDFYVGNSGYMKEMLLWPKRIHVRNDGRTQWYDLRAEIGYYFKFTESNEFLYTQKFTSLLDGKIVTAEGKKATETNPFEYTGSYDAADIRGLAWSIGSDQETTELNNPVDSQLFYMIPGIGVVVHLEFAINTSTLAEKIKYEVIGSLARPLVILQQYPQTLISAYFIIPKGSGYTPVGIKAKSKGVVFDNGSPRIGASISARMFECYAFEQYVDFGTGDINPIHKIREILTDDTAMNKPELSVNDENFMKAADVIWSEGLGVSWSITEKSCIDAINELCYHIEAGIRVNRQTGLYEMVLFRDDWFEDDEIHTIAESKIKSMQYEITNADEVINQVNVNYYDRANIKNSSFSISESGLIQTLGRVNAETLDFPYFMNMRNAEVVGNWKLKQLSTGAFKGSFTTGWREARKWNRYDLIRLPWSKRWAGTILVRIMSINLGGPTNNEVTIDFIEVVPATGMMNTSIVIDDPIDKPLPPQACQYEPFELPYYLAVMAIGQRKVDEELAYENNFGLVGVVAEQPQSNSLYAIMKTHSGIEGEEWLRAGSIQYSQTADLDQIISRASTSFTVKNWKKIANISTGTLIKCGQDWLGTPGEWMAFQGIDPYTGIVSVKRGALDTQPQEWGIDTKLYFCGNDISYDQTEYVSGEEVLVSALTTTPSGVLEQKGSIGIEMEARAIRPYSPANVKINGEYWPREIGSELILTWVDRNRLQQTGGDILGFYDGGVTLENGVTYQLIIYVITVDNVETEFFNQNIGTVNSYSVDISTAPATALSYRVILKSIKGAYESLHYFECVLNAHLPAPYDLTAEFI